MQNIHVERYEHPEGVGYQGLVRPEDGSWILFIPNEGMPQLLIEVEVAAKDVDDTAELDADTPTIKGYTSAIYLDDRVTVKPESELPCPVPEDTSGT